MATRLMILVVLLVAALYSSAIFRGQFHGEDEVGVLVTANWLAESLVNGHWSTVGQVLIGSYHPPGRFLLAMVSFLAFGSSIVTLRLPAYVVWVATCALSADITRRQTNSTSAGLLTGLLLGASGLFSLEAMGFGHGLFTFWVMLFVWFKVCVPLWDFDTPVARRQYVMGGLILALAFLWFTSAAPLVGLYHGYYLVYVLRRRSIEAVRQYAVLTLPFLFFYAAYYLIFLGLPWYAVQMGWRERPVGQLFQNLARRDSAHLTLASFIDNMRGINWYHLPFASWYLLLLGMVELGRRWRRLAIVLTPYALLFSFYIVDNTSQHFLSYYIWIIPFAVTALWRWGERGGPRSAERDWRGVVAVVLLALVVATASWGYITSVRQYTEATYPMDLAPAVFASGKWRTNLLRPLPDIAQDLPARLQPQDTWTSTIDGALNMYYFPDERFVAPIITEEQSSMGPCWRVVGHDTGEAGFKVIVRSRAQPPICDLVSVESVTYPDSTLELIRYY